MSQDLLAEFAEFSVKDTSHPEVQPNNIWASSSFAPTGQPLQPQSASQQLQSNAGTTDFFGTQNDPWGEVEEDDDDFGDFEVAGEDNPFPAAISTPPIIAKAVPETKAPAPSRPVPTPSVNPKKTVAPAKAPPEVRYQSAKAPTVTPSKKTREASPARVSAKAPPETRHKVERAPPKPSPEVAQATPARAEARVSPKPPPESRHKVEKAPPKAPVKTPVKPATKAPRRVSTGKRGKNSQLPDDHPMAMLEDVLFDADDFDDYAEGQFDDDFGDFETPEVPESAPTQSKNPQPAPKQTSQAAMFDLLGLDDDTQPIPTQTSQPPPPKAQPVAKSTKPNPTRKDPSPPSRQESTITEDDAWDDFESTPTAPQPNPPTTPSINLPHDLLGNLLNTTLPSPLTTPPTTIPPPSILLSHFSPLLTSLNSTVLLPITSLPTPEKSTFLSSPKTKTFLRTYISLLHTLSHILAGKKQRWKRDKFLAQSMRIGSASLSGGRSGGMKLAGLDKSETGREDAAAEDVLLVFGQQVGRLRSVLAAAGIGGGVPELAAVMPVRVARAEEGAIVSTGGCALCGLKREERVGKVDTGVEDSFGEWWVEGPGMHVGCRNFWEVQRGRLMGR